MHSLFNGLIFILGVTLALTKPNNKCPAATVEEAKKAESALADFAVNFYKNVSSKTQDKNAVMSPVSVALALAMLESGADGATQNKIKGLLAGSGSNTDILTAYRALQKLLQIGDEKTKLSIANSIYPKKNFALKPEFSQAIKECFEGEVENVDFAGQLEQSRQKINKWISEKTSKKIPELFKTGVLTPDTLLVLANAVYFKATWATAFYDGNTKPGSFYKFGREQDKQTVSFMKQTSTYRYLSERNLEAVEMAYSHQDLAMYILLPKTKDGLRALEQELTGEKLKGIMSRVQPTHVQLQLPKFVIRSPIDLKDTLTNLGLGEMFSDSANFERMSDADLKVSKAVHEAYINVNENGTEAAAATGFSMVPRSGAPRDPQQVIVDHPFLYAILHKPTGAILFLGKVNFVEEKDN